MKRNGIAKQVSNKLLKCIGMNSQHLLHYDEKIAKLCDVAFQQYLLFHTVTQSFFGMHEKRSPNGLLAMKQQKCEHLIYKFTFHNYDGILYKDLVCLLPQKMVTT